MRGWIEKYINRLRAMMTDGLEGRIFRLCLVVIAAAVCLYAVLDIIQLQLLRETARENSETQAN